MKFMEQSTRPALDPETANPNIIDKYYETANLEQEVACLMLSSMCQDLQRTLEKYNAYDMLKELKTMFEEQAKQELYLEILERLCYAMPNELGVSLILNSLNKDYDQFVQNYNMHNMGKTIAELLAMLKLNKKRAKGKDKGKNKLAYAPKPKISPPPKRDNPTKDSVCHHCKEVGHWRRNYPSYQAELKKRKNASLASTSGIFTIELYDFLNKTCVYDTGCGTHICNTSQGLRGSRKLKHVALSLYMGNGMRTVVEAIGNFDLVLHSGLIIVFETFKVFQNEVKNQVGKKIKVIRSNREGEYQSHEFVNHMKSCGIVSQHTPPYTPQHNGVFERRNQTLLDMVRSLKNLTTLPKSFWGYALESATRFLNMVPTKKVEMTPYEIWHGK
ncbi:zinc finger, CCHC-type containing protein [Tanacetum coccineum]|uniref:Zinc finger, CCHC-type containing protein n=1 Tax=Tanacetum coccineum TaxID=301880 RepID=A0ABQ5G0T2_9ASTR